MVLKRKSLVARQQTGENPCLLCTACMCAWVLYISSLCLIFSPSFRLKIWQSLPHRMVINTKKAPVYSSLAQGLAHNRFLKSVRYKTKAWKIILLKFTSSAQTEVWGLSPGSTIPILGTFYSRVWGVCSVCMYVCIFSPLPTCFHAWTQQ